jgi:hypothetical protein
MVSEPNDHRVNLHGATQPAVVDRAVYGTITIMSVLVVYDGWQKLTLAAVLGVIVGPIIAMFTGHVFSAVIAETVRVGRGLRGHERWALARAESRFLLLAVPPTVIAVVLNVSGVSLTGCIRVILLAGVASLGVWGGLAGHRAGLTGRRLVLAILAGLILGALILALQIFLQPGKAVTNGVA